MIKKATLAVLLLTLFASVFAAGAFSVSEAAPESVALPDDAHVDVSLTGAEQRFTFSPAASSVYSIYFFPDGEDAFADARLYRGGTLIASGGGSLRLLEASLSAGETYELALSGEGGGRLEVMRATLGRCFEKPIELSGDELTYEKLLVRPGDAHWYAFTASTGGPATIHAEPEGAQELLLCGLLMDAEGRVLAEAGGGAGGFVIDCELTAGARYYARVSALDASTGAYRLTVEQDTARAARPEAVALSAQELALDIGEAAALTASVSPADAHPTVTFTSSNSAVATVSQSGEVYAAGAGEAVITARAWGGASASCVVRVAGVPLSGIGFSQSALTLRVGESVGTSLELYPENASDRRVVYSVGNADVISVSPEGVVTGLAEGTARLVAVSADGGHTDILEVTVEPAAAKLRALIIGQQMYEEGVNSVRVGSINTAQSISFLLQEQDVDGESYETTVLLDSDRAETLAAIRTAFADAQEGDISLLYITCHGYYAHGMSFFELYDGSVIAARDLERELRKVPGTVVVIADCCGSGGLIGRASTLEDFNRGIVRVFSGNVGAPSFASGKYKVIASASLDQDSYRISFDENITESDMATVLARALCDGAGWSLASSRRAALRADMDYDRQITFGEIGAYVSRRVPWYLNVAGELAGASVPYVQNVQVWPEGDPLVLLGRQGQ